MEESILIVLVGLPRSGKSTWARQQGLPIVNPDSIRYAIHGRSFFDLAEPLVWAIAKVMVYALFLAGNSTVILDATNVTEKRRQEWISKNWRTEFKVFTTPKDECIKRAKEYGDNSLVEVIERMAAEWDFLGQTLSPENY